MQIIKKTNKFFKIIIIATLVIAFITPASLGNNNIKNIIEKNNETPYTGHLRIYIAEKESRWDDDSGKPYHFGFIDYAYNEKLSINYLDTYTDSITWNGDVEADNLIVFAAVFNPIANVGYAYPPETNPFEAHYVDAAAGATTGNTSYNSVTEDFTHTVFIEEGTATWCHNCPSMADSLYNISKTGDYPFYYVALIDDVNPAAHNRLYDDYNFLGFPTAFFDGGKEVIIGGDHEDDEFREKIESCGSRDVHELNLTISVEQMEKGEYQVDISITNNEEINYPIYKIGNIKGGFMKVRATISNTGGSDASNVEWEIKVNGGLLNIINVDQKGTFCSFPIGDKKNVKTKNRIFGLGSIDIIVRADTTTKTAKGFVIGSIVIVLR